MYIGRARTGRDRWPWIGLDYPILQASRGVHHITESPIKQSLITIFFDSFFFRYLLPLMGDPTGDA